MDIIQYTLKYRQKSMLFLADFVLFFFLFLIIRDNIRGFYPNSSFRIFYTLFCAFLGLGLFYLGNWMYNRKVILSIDGIIIHKFLQSKILIPWVTITSVQFKQEGYSGSEVGQIGTQGPLIYAMISDIKKVGKWTITISLFAEKNYKIHLFLIPFTEINNINPIIYQNSFLKYLFYTDTKNPKRMEVIWEWKREGSEADHQETLRFLEDISELGKPKKAI